MKTCSKCNKDIPIVEGRKRNICLPCHSLYTKKHYAENKNYYIEKASKRKIEIRNLIRNKKNIPCKDCKKKYPYYVMDFDHKGDKKFNISQFQTESVKTILQEIEKCDVVCANCHRERTHRRIKKPS